MTLHDIPSRLEFMRWPINQGCWQICKVEMLQCGAHCQMKLSAGPRLQLIFAAPPRAMARCMEKKFTRATRCYSGLPQAIAMRTLLTILTLLISAALQTAIWLLGRVVLMCVWACGWPSLKCVWCFRKLPSACAQSSKLAPTLMLDQIL